jgi:hypothetical protein
MSPDIAASVRARLLNQAKQRGEEFERTLARYASERLLFRLGASAVRDRCTLKGASLLSVWMPDPYRATRDVDVLASGPTDEQAIRSMIEEICTVACPEDGLRFDLSGLIVEAIRVEEEYSGMRARFRAYLGTARIAVQLDIGVGDALSVAPEEITIPTLLSPMPAPRLRAYPREQAIAEKFEAMVKLGTQNSRMKDFHDMWALAGAFEFDGTALQGAIAACFERRRMPWTVETPSALTPDFYALPELTTRWRHYLAAGAVMIPPPARFEDIGERIMGFLGPVRESILAGAQLEALWPPAGPWVSAKPAGG